MRDHVIAVLDWRRARVKPPTAKRAAAAVVVDAKIALHKIDGAHMRPTPANTSVPAGDPLDTSHSP